jgi:hypothetical protein
VADDNGGSSLCRDVTLDGCGGTLSADGPEPREGPLKAPGDLGWLLPTLLPLRETGDSTSAIGITPNKRDQTIVTPLTVVKLIRLFVGANNRR